MAMIINGINVGEATLVDKHPVIELNLNTREFTWPTTDDGYKVVAITGDANSQKLTFEIPAEYEGIQLKNTTCVLTYWTSWTNEEGLHSTGTINLTPTTIEDGKDNYIYYSWILDQLQTAKPGEVRFKLGFYLILDDFDLSGYNELSFIITEGYLAIYNTHYITELLEPIYTTDNYYALSSNSGTFNVIPDRISEQAKIRLVDWATRAEQAANEATGAANNANIQIERAKEATNNAKEATNNAEEATQRTNVALSNLDTKINELAEKATNAEQSADDAATSAAMAENFVNSISDMTNYIIEESESPVVKDDNTPLGSNWHITKWKNGKIECCTTIEGEINPEEWKAWADTTIYYAVLGVIKFPVIFNFIPTVSYDLDAQDSWGNKYKSTTTNTGNLYAVAPILHTGTDVEKYTINLIVKGYISEEGGA